MTRQERHDRLDEARRNRQRGVLIPAEDQAKMVGRYHPAGYAFAPFRVGAKMRYPAAKASALVAV